MIAISKSNPASLCTMSGQAFSLLSIERGPMKKKKVWHEQTNGTTHNHIPDIEIIDLELDGNIDSPEPEEDTGAAPLLEETSADTKDAEAPDAPPKKGLRSFLNIHMLLAAVFLVVVVSLIAKFRNWGVFVDLNDIDSDYSLGYLDVLDQFLPVTDDAGNVVSTDVVENIVVFGNAPFADDRDSEDSLANLIAENTGAQVYNCSVSNSYLATQHPYFDANVAPMDAYSFYWLITLGVGGINAHYYPEAEIALGASLPPEAQEVYDTLTTLDFNEVDVVAVMYDASDYLMGHEMYDDLNSTNIQCFTGNLEAGIELLTDNYPHIRVIVLSPTYAYAVNEEGEYVSSDMYRYGQDVLSTYVIKQSDSCNLRSVSFVDNLYGTITEDNADKYLIDNIHLNTDGRKLVADRFLKALKAYSEIKN